MPSESIRKIKLSDIKEPDLDVRLQINPDIIRELAENIKEIGLLQPITLRSPGPPYEIAYGHRRFLAFKFLNEQSIPSFIHEISDEDLFFGRVSENIQKEDLSPIEEGKAYKYLIDKYKCSINKLSKKFGKPPSRITSCIDCLDYPDFAKHALVSKFVSLSTLTTLNKIHDQNIRDLYFRYACENGATSEVANQWLNSWRRLHDLELEKQSRPDTVDKPPSRPVYATCAACNGPSKADDMQMIYLCNDCYRYIIQGADIHLHTPAEGDH